MSQIWRTRSMHNNSTGSVDTVPVRRPVWGHGVTSRVIHRAAANLSNELIYAYAVLEVSREGIFRFVYVSTDLMFMGAANVSRSAIVSTKEVALQGKKQHVRSNKCNCQNTVRALNATNQLTVACKH